MKPDRNYLLLILRGCAMGAADVVPGVSGGTIAFITGIYEELIDSIKSIDLQALKLLARFRWKEFWRKINGNFLLAVVAGIGTSIFSLAKLMTWLLENHPIYIWSFFFGLIIASSILVAKEIKTWNLSTVAALLEGREPAHTHFQAMPPSVQKTYARAYLDAKTSAGREKRLAWITGRLDKNLRPM